MKYLISILFISSTVFSQTSDVNFEDLIEQYPQLSAYQSYQNNSSNISDDSQVKFDFTDYTESELLLLDSLGVLEFLLDTVAVDETLIFGYKFFNSPEKFAIFDNIPIPSDYVLGTGDHLIISIWGATQLKSRHLIGRDGSIFIDEVGRVNLAGMELETAENILRDRFSKVYATLEGRKPSTFLNISLGRLKSINVSFVGEVNRPGLHAIHPFSDITMALLQASGVDTVGSLRDIQVIRNGKTISSFDFYNFLVDGKTDQNVRLLNGDVIFVPARNSTVEIIGEINRPGIYEAKEGETVAELLRNAGGLTPKAQQKIEIYRLLPQNERMSEDFAYNVKYINWTNANNEPASDLTKIRVLGIPDVSRQVSILGQVKTPGDYAYDNSMYLLDLLKIAGGLDDETYHESIYTKEAEVIRQVPNSIYPARIAVNLDELLDGKTDQNLKLNNQDVVIIRVNSKYVDPKYVTILGKVNVPGTYTIQKKEETLNQIIRRAGGFSANAYKNGLCLYRDSTQVALKGYNIFVADGDSIYVPESPGVVKIQGEVNREGLAQYVKGKSLGYYIEQAGGFTYQADKKNVTVQYANGNVRQKKNYLFSLISNSPPVEDGATITVYKKEPKPPFNVTQFLSATASAATSLVTLYLVYEQAKGN